MDVTVPALSSLAGVDGPGPCPVCGTQECRPDGEEHLATYPFLPGGKDPMAGKDYVIAPHRIVDHDRGVVLYGTGDRVPLADAVRFGLVAGPADDAVQPPPDAAPEPANAKKGRRTRHHPAPSEDRSA